MSIAEFTGVLRNKGASAAARVQAEKYMETLNRLATSSTAAYTSKSQFQRAGSIINENATALRDIGEKQGSTRLVVTEDTLSQMLKTFGISVTESEAVGTYLKFLEEKYGAKYKAKHFEFYMANGETLPATKSKVPLGDYLRSIDSKEVIAVRGLNFSHANTLRHMSEFIKYATTTPLSLKDIQDTIGELYERGHIIAATTGRQLTSIGGISAENTILDKIVQLSIDLDKASSSLSNSKYSKVMAAIEKDFNGPRMFMNIEFQLIRDLEGKGNQDSADITRGLRAISSLANLLSNVTLGSTGRLLSKPVVTNITLAAKNLENLLKKIEKQEESIVKVLSGYIADPGTYVLDLKSSDSFNEHISKILLSTFKGIPLPKTKVNHGNQQVYSVKRDGIANSVKTLPSIKALVSSRKKALANVKTLANSTFKPIELKTTKTFSLTSLQNLLDAQLQHVIAANMGNGQEKRILNYRTGRLAASAKVERLSMSKEGAITAFYSYMRNPYGTFSEGGKQQYPKTRDPKLLISQSIREIAATKVANRLRAVLV